MEVVNNRTSYGQRANKLRERAGHKTTWQLIITEWKTVHSTSGRFGNNLDEKPVRLQFHWRLVNRREDCSFLPTEGSVLIWMRSQIRQTTDLRAVLNVGTNGSYYGYRGELSVTEGKTAHSNQWKVQYQSGWQTNPNIPKRLAGGHTR